MMMMIGFILIHVFELVFVCPAYIQSILGQPISVLSAELNVRSSFRCLCSLMRSLLLYFNGITLRVCFHIVERVSEILLR